MALQPPGWQRELAQAVTDPRVLLARLGLDPALAGDELEVAEAMRTFPLRVPESFVARMRPGDPHDPLLRQVLPLGAERRTVEGFVADPLEEAEARLGGGLLQKYRGRALLIATGACGVHCRYCFRREYPYAGERDPSVPGGRWSEALAAIAADPSIEEVLLSGGDPLSLGNARLAEIGQGLARIPHVKRLRIHTRQPIELPSRVDAGLTAWLAGLPLPVVIVVHANHANEIDAGVVAALQRLRAAGATLLNQSVLLAGVNDNSAALADLSRTLFAAGVLPYYLHLLDRVRGTAHFEVDETVALRIVATLMAELPGYLVPRLVREVAHAPSKVPVSGM